MNLNDLTNLELLQISQYALDELELRSVLKKRNNPIDEYTLWLVENKLKMRSIPLDQEGYYARSLDGRNINIIAKTHQLKNSSSIVGFISERDLKLIDDVMLIIYNSKYYVTLALIIPRDSIIELGIYNKLKKGYTLRASHELINSSKTTNITELLFAKPDCKTLRDLEYIKSALKVIGKNTFVDFYNYFQDDIPIGDVIKKMATKNINWNVTTARVKAKKMKEVFKRNDNLKALKVIVDSKSTLANKTIKEEAIKLIENNPPRSEKLRNELMANL